jgi:hypothetical protein
MSIFNRIYVKTELFANKVDGTDITTADWAFLGTLDQNISKSDEVEFKSVTINNTSFNTKIQTSATSDYTLTLPVDDGLNGDVLISNGLGVLSWSSTGGFDQSLDIADSVQFTDMVLTGNLTVQGDTTLIENTNLSITDNIILLNNGETGAGVTSGTSGIEIDRGTLQAQRLLWDESTGIWTVGETGNAKRIAEISSSQTHGAIPGYDADGRFSESEGLTPIEVSQLQNIGETTISAANWGHVSSFDQDLGTTDTVTFDNINVTETLTLVKPVVHSILHYLANASITAGISIFDASISMCIATLPDNITSAGMCYIIVLKSPGYDLHINPDGDDSIEGEMVVTLNTAGQHIRVCSTGDGIWLIL